MCGCARERVSECDSVSCVSECVCVCVRVCARERVSECESVCVCVWRVRDE